MEADRGWRGIESMGAKEGAGGQSNQDKASSCDVCHSNINSVKENENNGNKTTNWVNKTGFYDMQRTWLGRDQNKEVDA